LIQPAEWVEAHEHPAAFADYLSRRDKFMRPPHVELLSREIAQAVFAGDGRFIVTMPPRHGKSTLCSAWLPFWFLNLFPQKDVMLVSYGAEFAQKWGLRVRRLAAMHRESTLMRLSPESRRASEWETVDGGGMKCLGISGDATGRGADLLIIDDPVKNSEEARSEVMRSKTWEFWQETLRTRVEPGGTIVVVQTRWHEDDLAGRLIATDDQPGHERWQRIDFPAIAECEDVLGRSEGEALWPERFPIDRLVSLRDDRDGVGYHAFAALYQQRPTPEGGGMFRKQDFRYFSYAADGSIVIHHGDGEDERIQPTSCWRAQIVDTAMKTKTVNDWTVVGTFAITKKRQLLVLDINRQRIEIPDQLPLIRSGISKYKPRWVAIEDKASGIGIIQEARRQGLILRPLKPIVDKVSRASSAAALMEQHAIFFLRDARWLETFESELQGFPNASFDDQVDVLAYMVIELAPQAGYAGTKRLPRRTGLVGINDGELRW